MCLLKLSHVQCCRLRGVPVFAVPGVYLTLPSPRGNVRFTPLFLSRRLLDDTVAAAQDLATKSVI